MGTASLDLSARSDTPQRMRNIIHAVEPCTPPELVSGYFYHIRCAWERGVVRLRVDEPPLDLTLYRFSLEASASGGPRSVTCTGLLIPSSTGRKGVLRVGTIPRERGAFYHVARKIT